MGQQILGVYVLYDNQVVTSWILKLSLSFQSSRFFNMTKKSRQKFKYLENEKSFKDEISIFQHFWRAIIKVKKQKKIFWKWKPDFSLYWLFLILYFFHSSQISLQSYEKLLLSCSSNQVRLSINENTVLSERYYKNKMSCRDHTMMIHNENLSSFHTLLAT